ncbi:hypothetical protein C0991_001220 [Blastosporella zonata]|nr:hypothetical protein C0991_001220 [Blastosporella zonata]
MGTIFQSSRDTLRETQSLHRHSTDMASQNKRSRSQGDQGYDSDGAVDEERDAKMDPATEDGNRLLEQSRRPVKSLPKLRKSMLQTRSLPATTFAMGGHEATNDVVMNKVEEEEEDWSAGSFAPQDFKPIQDAL